MKKIKALLNIGQEKIEVQQTGKGKGDHPAVKDLVIKNLRSPNLVKNPSGANGLQHWTTSGRVIVERPPVGVDQFFTSGAALSSAFVTSNSWGRMSQVIDLHNAGFSYKVMKTMLPFEFTISLIVGARVDCGGMYEVHAFMKKDPKDATKLCEAGVLKETLNEKDGWLPIMTTLKLTDRHLASLEQFRYLILEIQGKDNKIWAGDYGIKFTNISVTGPCTTS